MKHIKSTVSKHPIIAELFLIAFMVLTLDSIFFIRYGFQITFIHLFIAFFNIALVVSILYFIKNYKKRYIAYFIYILIMFTFFITDSTLYKFKQDVTSIAMLLESGRNTMVIGLKYNPLSAYNIFIWIAIFGFVFIIIRALYRTTKNNANHQPKLVFQFLFFTCSIIGLSLSPKLINQADAMAFETTSDKSLFVQKFGSVTYHMRDIVTFTSNTMRPIFFRDDYIEQINDKVTDEQAPTSQFNGLLTGKNIIMIMCETCEDYAYSEALTPNYYRLKNQSVVFNQFYGAAKTDYTYDAEFKSLTSMMYFQADNYMYSRGENYFPQSLPSMLKSAGYTTNSFHNYHGSFFNRDVMHLSLGFESFYALEDLNILPGDYWPLDSMMFDQFKDLIVPLQENPFFSFVITVTPHGPHNKYRNELKAYYDIIDQMSAFQNESIEYKTITAAQMDFDKGLGILLDDLDHKGILDDTVIIIYSDHKNYSSLELTYEKTAHSARPYEVDKLPFMIFANGLDPMINSTLTSHYDIAPTVMDLLGISYYKDFYYGQSIFLENRIDKPIILSHSNWISKTHKVLFDQVVEGNITAEEFMLMKIVINQTIDFYEMMMFSDYFNSKNPFFETPVITSNQIEKD